MRATPLNGAAEALPPGAGEGNGLIQGEDPLDDETCGAGPDAIITGGKPNPRAVPQGSFTRQSPNGPIRADGFPFCVLSIGASSATVVCDPGPQATCLSPGLLVLPTAGTISGSTWCTGSPVASATATAPATAHDIEHGVFGFPWICNVSFSPGARGTLVCDAPDP